MNMDDRQLQQRSCVQERRFVCPLTKQIMTDAVRINCTGKSYERQALFQWIEQNGQICPVTGVSFRAKDVETNFGLQWEILYWQRRQSSSANYSVDDTATVTSSSATSVSCHHHNSPPPPPPPGGPFDSPPVRPKRRGSGNAAARLEDSVRFKPFTENSSDTSLQLPRRVPSYLIPIAPCVDDTDRDDGALATDRLVSVLDTAIQISEEF
jgi:hypothetical protein